MTYATLAASPHLRHVGTCGVGARVVGGYDLARGARRGRTRANGCEGALRARSGRAMANARRDPRVRVR